MNRYFFYVIMAFILLSLSACGGGGGDEKPVDSTPVNSQPDNNDNTDSSTGDNTDTDNNDANEPAPALPVVSLSVVDGEAIEVTQDMAKFKITRTGDLSAVVTVNYKLLDNTDTVVGQGSLDDITMSYSDGGQTNDTLILPSSQNTRVIELAPVQDELNEAPEYLTIILEAGDGYTLGTDVQATARIVDAPNTQDHAKVFVGTFGPQGDVVTQGTGVLSFILAGDNSSGSLSYAFSGLNTEQVDQHIHLAPSGTMIKDIEHLGNVSGYVWDLAPGGPFRTRQEMLDALYSGSLYVNIHTASDQGGEIMALMNYNADIAPPEQIALTPEAVDRDIVRFLNQATFGATPEDYNALRAQIDTNGDNRLLVYENWIEQQFAMPASSMLELTDFSHQLFAGEDGWDARRDTLWTMGTFSKDQLRQRMAFALSEILVIGDQLKTTRRAYRGVSQYWDLLGENAFGTYRKALEDASLHPVMGFWLSSLYNQKMDEVEGTFPDENYAREIMQLFSFGLVHRQANGSISLGADNLPMPTYDNQVIRDMAKVFTGLSFSYKNSGENKIENNSFFSGTGTNEYQYRWTEPMRFFADYHDFGEKTLFSVNGESKVVPASGEETEAAAMSELRNVLDMITAHPSTAPYICRQLIQRLVTSNPSGDYLARVVNAFGTTGDMRSTIKAILLDSEARNPASALSVSAGKFKEPMIQLIANFRLFGGTSPLLLDNSESGVNYPSAHHYRAGASMLRVGELAIGQYALGAETVFNFFSPDHSPTGRLAEQSLVSPELQLLTETQLIINYNYYHSLLSQGLANKTSHKKTAYDATDVVVTLSPTNIIELYQTTEGDDIAKATAVVDFMDFYLTGGRVKLDTDNVARAAMIASIAAADEDEKVALALYGVNTLPDFLIIQ